MKRRLLVALAILATACAAPRAPAPDRAHALDPPAHEGALAPYLSATRSGLLLTWLEPEGDGRALRVARLARGSQGWRWETPSTIASGREFFANWADVPSLIVSKDGRWHAHWLEKSAPGTYAYDVQMARSEDQGRSWSRPVPVHGDGTATEHGFASLVEEGDGVRAFWLDGREMVREEGRMALRTALAGDGPADEEVLDASTCECCQTGAALTSRGPVVVYRGRSSGEVRDVRIVRRAEGRWSPPALVRDDGWIVPGCPVNGPAIASQGESGERLAVAWYTAADENPRVLAAFSEDAGATFGEAVVIDQDDPPGRADIVLDENGDAIVAWLAGGGSGGQPGLRLRRVRPDGAMGAAMTLAPASAARGSGFPRIAREGADLIVAWTDPGPPQRLRASVVPHSVVPATGEPVARPSRPEQDAGPVDFTAVDLEGRPWSLAALRGRPVLLNLWATWCLPCREEMPALSALHQAWSGKGLQVVGVSVDEAGKAEEVRRQVGAAGIAYLIVLDPEDLASRRFGVTMLPTTLLFDRAGRLVWRRDGVIRQDDVELREAVEQALTPREAL